MEMVDNSNNRVNVKCYDDYDNSLICNVGSQVPEGKYDDDFERIAYYGDSYNIYDLNSGNVIIVRYKYFIKIKKYNQLTYEDIHNYLCIDSNGCELNVQTVDDYKQLKEVESNKDRRILKWKIA